KCFLARPGIENVEGAGDELRVHARWRNEEYTEWARDDGTISRAPWRRGLLHDLGFSADGKYAVASDPATPKKAPAIQLFAIDGGVPRALHRLDLPLAAPPKPLLTTVGGKATLVLVGEDPSGD